jgi:hypothetical protein
MMTVSSSLGAAGRLQVLNDVTNRKRSNATVLLR